MMPRMQWRAYPPSCALLAALVLAGMAVRSKAEPAPGAHVYENQRHGFSLLVPAEVSRPTPIANHQDGAAWSSPDGQARLVAVAAPNETGETLADYRRFVIERTYVGARFDYTPMRKAWFVLSGTQGDRTFYERINFACGGRYIYGWQIVYPTAQSTRFDRVVEAIHRSYRVGRRPEGSCR